MLANLSILDTLSGMFTQHYSQRFLGNKRKYLLSFCCPRPPSFMETKGLGHVPGARIRCIAEPGETKQVPGPFKWSVSIPLPSFLLLNHLVPNFLYFNHGWRNSGFCSLWPGRAACLIDGISLFRLRGTVLNRNYGKLLPLNK